VRDGSSQWNTFTFDGLDITDPHHPGLPLQYPDVASLQSMTVTSSLTTADMAAAGAEVVLVPRRPRATREGAIEFSVTTPRMVSDASNPVAPPIQRMQSWDDVNAQFGAPMSAQAGIFLAGRLTRSDHVDRSKAFSTPGDVNSIFGHLVFTSTGRDEVRVLTSVQGTRQGFDATPYLSTPVDERDTFVHTQVNWDRVSANGTIRTLTAGVQRGVQAPDVNAQTPVSSVDRALDGEIPSPASHVAIDRLDLHAGLALPGAQLGSTFHSVRFDAAVTSSSDTSHVLAAPSIAERDGGLAARVWQFTVPTTDSHRRLSQISGSADDQMRLASWLTVDAGARFDWYQGEAAGASQTLNLQGVSPRVSFRAHASRIATLFGGYSLSHPRPSLDWLSFGDPDGTSAKLLQWTDTNADGTAQESEIGPQVALAGWGGATGAIDPGLRLPSTSEMVVGLERRVGPALLRVTANFRHQTSLVQVVNDGIPLSSYTQFLIPDQTDDALLLPVFNRPAGLPNADHYLLTNPAGGTLDYKGLDVTCLLPITDHLQMRVAALEYKTSGPGAAPGFLASENDQGVLTELFVDPNTTSHVNGAMFYDRSYVLKWSGSYLAPHGWWAAFTANYRDGEPFAGVIAVPGLTQGAELIQNYRRGRTRFTYTVTLDARVEKRFTISGHEAALSVDVLNLPNLGNEVEEFVVETSTFRLTSAIQPPRTIRVGLRVGF
jgi:hypothetical protein